MGGTYICQQNAEGLQPACQLWRDHVVAGRYIQGLEVDHFADAFDADIDELPPVSIDEVRNVWLFQLLIGEDMLSAHIILTDLTTLKVSEASKSMSIPTQSLH